MNLQIFDFFMDGVLALNKIGEVIYCNQKMADFLGGSSVRIAKNVPLETLFTINQKSIRLDIFSEAYEGVRSILGSYESKYKQQGTGQISFIPLTDEKELLGLVVLKDLSHEVELDEKYQAQLKAKDQKILEMQVLLDLSSNVRSAKEPLLLLREVSLHLIRLLKVPWVLNFSLTNTMKAPTFIELQRTLRPQFQNRWPQWTQFIPTPKSSLFKFNPRDEGTADFLFAIDQKNYSYYLLKVDCRGQGHSLLLLPLEDGKELQESELQLIEAVLSQSSIMMENAELQVLSITDELTQVFNVRYFNNNLEQILRESEAHSKSFSIFTFDVDFFKKINDSYGHPGGDAVLRKVGEILKGLCRNFDLPARVGGEEFSLILPETKRDDAAKAAEKFRKAFEAAEIKFEDRVIKFTSSFGVASYPENGASVESLVKAADEALYKSKTNGRNRVTLA